MSCLESREAPCIVDSVQKGLQAFVAELFLVRHIFLFFPRDFPKLIQIDPSVACDWLLHVTIESIEATFLRPCVQ